MTDGIILIDKPADMTSFSVVARIRRVLSEEKEAARESNLLRSRLEEEKPSAVPRKRQRVKVGHTGTLDPFATGLMILVVGKECKNADHYTKLDKVYEATIILGQTSSTGDPEGEIVDFARNSSAYSFSDHSLRVATPASDVGLTGKVPVTLSSAEQTEEFRPELSRIQEVLKQFTGTIQQRPPIFSAIKINGKRAYKLARDGQKVELPLRNVHIYSLELISYEYPVLKIRTHVSSGTYIRSLAVDIGQALGTGAYCQELRRLSIDKWQVGDAKTLADFGITS